MFCVFLLIEILPAATKITENQFNMMSDKIRKKRIMEFEIIVQHNEKIVNIRKINEINIATEKENQKLLPTLRQDTKYHGICFAESEIKLNNTTHNF